MLCALQAFRVCVVCAFSRERLAQSESGLAGGEATTTVSLPSFPLLSPHERSSPPCSYSLTERSRSHLAGPKVPLPSLLRPPPPPLPRRPFAAPCPWKLRFRPEPRCIRSYRRVRHHDVLPRAHLVPRLPADYAVCVESRQRLDAQKSENGSVQKVRPCYIPRTGAS